jgi:two-component system, OmpR family, phosphate regulon response regulator PhoB
MEKRKILVIDDDRTMLEIVTFDLGEAGFEIACANRGREGLKMAQDSPPDAILLDRNMPDMTGIEVLEALKKDPRTASIPVLMLTGDSKSKDVSQSLEMGARDYVVKPFDPNGLLLRVRNALRK